MERKHIVIAGGTGLIGNKLVPLLESRGFKVSVLSRNPDGPNQFFWDPSKKQIDFPEIAETDILINLSGAGIADQRWTPERKKVLLDSRVGANEFLFSLSSQMPKLKQFISSSGINCYGYEHPERLHLETDDFGNDYLSTLVRDWEQSADLFQPVCPVAKIRTAVVLDRYEGALKKMLPMIRMGAGSAIGTGRQMMPWIHVDDLARVFLHVIEKELSGTYNAVTDSISNKDFLWTLTRVLKKSFYLPNVPEFLMKTMFGEMSIMLLKGVKASNEKLISTGFVFTHPTLEGSFRDLFKR